MTVLFGETGPMDSDRARYPHVIESRAAPQQVIRATINNHPNNQPQVENQEVAEGSRRLVEADAKGTTREGWKFAVW